MEKAAAGGPVFASHPCRCHPSTYLLGERVPVDRERWALACGGVGRKDYKNFSGWPNYEDAASVEGDGGAGGA